MSHPRPRLEAPAAALQGSQRLLEPSFEAADAAPQDEEGGWDRSERARPAPFTEGRPVVAGIGFRKACPAEEIVALVRRGLEVAGLPPEALSALAAPASRADDASLRAAAARLGVPILPVDPAALVAVDPLVPTRSPRALAAHGVGSVAEAAALAAAGADRLALPRIAGPAATCALARFPDPVPLPAS